MSAIMCVKIPWELDKPLESLLLEKEDDEGSSVGNGAETTEAEKPGAPGDRLPKYLRSISENPDQITVETTPLKRMAPVNEVVQNYFNAINLAGVYTHHISPIQIQGQNQGQDPSRANLRATCLSMACGLHSKRFYGDVYLSRLGYFVINDELKLSNSSIVCEEVEAACITPDLREGIIRTLRERKYITSDALELPSWLTEASRNNYEDSGALSVLASVMKIDKKEKDRNLNDDANENQKEGEENPTPEKTAPLENDETKCIDASNDETNKSTRTFITRVPLCLHCRRPADTLCPICKGAYFCKYPKPCRDQGWSHQCICRTWQIYTERRELLGSFPFFKNWVDHVISRECQVSDEPYRDFLSTYFGVLGNNANDAIENNDVVNWWNTEGDGWSGGGSQSAKNINILKRLSYQEGFALEDSYIPPERPVTKEDCIRAKISTASSEYNVNMLVLNSWEDYYNLREISMESPVALLLTFPLTIYFALMKFGEVPITVANMLNRPLRIHVVGVEKELNFLDMFKEVAFLLPEGLEVELVFIVRDDMLPESCMEALQNGKQGLSLQLTPTFTLIVQSGSYNSEDMDPQFDCGSGPPDMLIGMNAGLFAYESWRSVIEYLDVQRGVVGCFTDYNEHSGVNCASLGGGKARESLTMNPFRQPHAMPVYSMNLPQFSNGFMYVFNEQELD